MSEVGDLDEFTSLVGTEPASKRIFCDWPGCSASAVPVGPWGLAPGWGCVGDIPPDGRYGHLCPPHSERYEDWACSFPDETEAFPPL